MGLLCAQVVTVVSLPCMLLWQHVGDSQLWQRFCSLMSNVVDFLQSANPVCNCRCQLGTWRIHKTNCPRQCGLMLAARDGHFPPTSVELLHASHEDQRSRGDPQGATSEDIRVIFMALLHCRQVRYAGHCRKILFKAQLLGIFTGNKQHFLRQ